MTGTEGQKSVGKAMRTSIVIPCYNAERTLPATLDTVLDHLNNNSDIYGPWELIVIDDGSSDSTIDVCETYGAQSRVIRMERNMGKGAAVRRGMLEARGDYRFFMDADAPYDLGIVPVMMRYLDVKEFDVVIGARDLSEDLARVERTFLRKIASAVFTALVGRVVITGVRDTQCGLKGFRGACADQLFGASCIDGFAFDVEVLYLAHKCNYDIKRFPVELVREDESTVSVIRHGLPMLRDVLLLPFRYHAGRYTLTPKSFSEEVAS